MQACPECTRVFTDDYSFCPIDGEELIPVEDDDVDDDTSDDVEEEKGEK